MKKHIYDEKTGISYTLQGDYYLPDIALSTEEQQPVGFIFKIIEPSDGVNKLSRIYDFIMMGTIIVSVVPLVFKTSNALFMWIDYISVSIFIIDYILRFITADLKLEKSIGSFFSLSHYTYGNYRFIVYSTVFNSLK